MFDAKEFEGLITNSNLAVELSLRLHQEVAAIMASLHLASDQAVLQAKQYRSLVGTHSQTNYLWGNIPLTMAQRQEARRYWLSLASSASFHDLDEVEVTLAATSIPVHDAVTSAIVVFLLEGLEYRVGKTPFD
jgi:hypothetical protein